jgi:hypothetical protein
MSRYVFDAEILLSKITKEMNSYSISDERKKEFIYFNPGWDFGKKSDSTIGYDQNFLNNCLPYLENRNEIIFRWIVPVNLEYGCVWICEPPPYASTYY